MYSLLIDAVFLELLSKVNNVLHCIFCQWIIVFFCLIYVFFYFWYKPSGVKQILTADNSAGFVQFNMDNISYF